MKKIALLIFLLLLLCRFLYPHTRFAFEKKMNLTSEKHLNRQTATLSPGESISITLVGIRKLARYSSSDFRIASVSASGKVCAHKLGTAIISVQQGDNVYRCKITVRS